MDKGIKRRYSSISPVQRIKQPPEDADNSNALQFEMSRMALSRRRRLVRDEREDREKIRVLSIPENNSSELGATCNMPISSKQHQTKKSRYLGAADGNTDSSKQRQMNQFRDLRTVEEDMKSSKQRQTPKFRDLTTAKQDLKFVDRLHKLGIDKAELQSYVTRFWRDISQISKQTKFLEDLCLDVDNLYKNCFKDSVDKEMELSSVVRKLRSYIQTVHSEWIKNLDCVVLAEKIKVPEQDKGRVAEVGEDKISSPTKKLKVSDTRNKACDDVNNNSLSPSNSNSETLVTENASTHHVEQNKVFEQNKDRLTEVGEDKISTRRNSKKLKVSGDSKACDDANSDSLSPSTSSSETRIKETSSPQHLKDEVALQHDEHANHNSISMSSELVPSVTEILSESLMEENRETSEGRSVVECQAENVMRTNGLCSHAPKHIGETTGGIIKYAFKDTNLENSADLTDVKVDEVDPLYAGDRISASKIIPENEDIVMVASAEKLDSNTGLIKAPLSDFELKESKNVREEEQPEGGNEKESDVLLGKSGEMENVADSTDLKLEVEENREYPKKVLSKSDDESKNVVFPDSREREKAVGSTDIEVDLPPGKVASEVLSKSDNETELVRGEKETVADGSVDEPVDLPCDEKVTNEVLTESDNESENIEFPEKLEKRENEIAIDFISEVDLPNDEKVIKEVLSERDNESEDAEFSEKLEKRENEMSKSDNETGLVRGERKDGKTDLPTENDTREMLPKSDNETELVSGKGENVADSGEIALVIPRYVNESENVEFPEKLEGMVKEIAIDSTDREVNVPSAEKLTEEVLSKSDNEMENVAHSTDGYVYLFNAGDSNATGKSICDNDVASYETEDLIRKITRSSRKKTKMMSGTAETNELPSDGTEDLSRKTTIESVGSSKIMSESAESNELPSDATDDLLRKTTIESVDTSKILLDSAESNELPAVGTGDLSRKTTIESVGSPKIMSENAESNELPSDATEDLLRKTTIESVDTSKILLDSAESNELPSDGTEDLSRKTTIESVGSPKIMSESAESNELPSDATEDLLRKTTIESVDTSKILLDSAESNELPAVGTGDLSRKTTIESVGSPKIMSENAESNELPSDATEDLLRKTTIESVDTSKILLDSAESNELPSDGTEDLSRKTTIESVGSPKIMSESAESNELPSDATEDLLRKTTIESVDTSKILLDSAESNELPSDGTEDLSRKTTIESVGSPKIMSENAESNELPSDATEDLLRKTTIESVDTSKILSNSAESNELPSDGTEDLSRKTTIESVDTSKIMCDSAESYEVLSYGTEDLSRKITRPTIVSVDSSKIISDSAESNELLSDGPEDLSRKTAIESEDTSKIMFDCADSNKMPLVTGDLPMKTSRKKPSIRCICTPSPVTDLVAEEEQKLESKKISSDATESVDATKEHRGYVNEKHVFLNGTTITTSHKLLSGGKTRENSSRCRYNHPYINLVADKKKHFDSRKMSPDGTKKLGDAEEQNKYKYDNMFLQATTITTSPKETKFYKPLGHLDSVSSGVHEIAANLYTREKDSDISIKRKNLVTKTGESQAMKIKEVLIEDVRRWVVVPDKEIKTTEKSSPLSNEWEETNLKFKTFGISDPVPGSEIKIGDEEVEEIQIDYTQLTQGEGSWWEYLHGTVHDDVSAGSSRPVTSSTQLPVPPSSSVKSRTPPGVSVIPILPGLNKLVHPSCEEYNTYIPFGNFRDPFDTGTTNSLTLQEYEMQKLLRGGYTLANPDHFISKT